VTASTGQSVFNVAGEGLDNFTDFADDDRVGVISTGNIAVQQLVSVVFNGTFNGVAGIYEVDVKLQEIGGIPTSTPQPLRSVARVGDTVKDALGVTKTISGVSLYDPFNNLGSVVLWASFGGGGQGIVRALPDRERRRFARHLGGERHRRRPGREPSTSI
jgi:hypothetical protein